MNRIQIIQSLIDKNNYKSYLEIGVQAGHCFKTIICDNKVGVDPDINSAATHHMSSDDFFETFLKYQQKPAFIKDEKGTREISVPEKYDICFSDGLHHAPQSERDILNMLDVLNDGGVIVCHDMLPNSKRMQEIPLQEQNEWCGNVWLSWVKLRMTRPDLEMVCINTDWGTSLIKKGKQEVLKTSLDLSYENFEIHKHEWMNIISVDQFKARYLD